MPIPQFHIGIKNNVTADAGYGTCELYFLDTIQDKQVFDWSSMQMTTQSLLAEVVNQVNYYAPKKITCTIDSWGGDADLGKGIYNFLKSHSAKVECDILNKAASAATLIACAGSKIRMPKTGMYVIHQASNTASGTAAVLREAANVADLYTDAYCEAYANENRKGKTKDEIKGLIANGDYWMTGEQAKEMGFIDECYNDESVSVTANIEAAKLIYGDRIPASLIAMSMAQAIETKENDSILSKINDAMKSFGELVTSALAAIKGTKVTAKVGDEMQVDISAAITGPLTDLAAHMQTEVTAEMGAMETRVTAAMETKYGAQITAMSAENATLKANLETLTADVIALAGKESRPGAKNTGSANTGRKTLGDFA